MRKLYSKLKEKWQVIKIRWQAKTPKFFKKARKTALTVGCSCIAIVGVSITPGITLDPIFIKVISYVIVACAAVAGTAQLTKDTTDEKTS